VHLDLICDVCGYREALKTFTHTLTPNERAILNQIYDADKLVLASYGPLKNERRGPQSLTDHLDAPVKVGANAVKLIDKEQTRNAVLIRLPPHCLSLGLDPSNAIEQGDRTVKNP
jgi:hypothetical protein